MTNDCKRYTGGLCFADGKKSECVGKDCGAYEPIIQSCRDCKYNRSLCCVVHGRRVEENMSCSHWSNKHDIPSRCRSCAMFSGTYCEVHKHLIEDSDNCSEWWLLDGNYPESDLHISVAKLREILEEIASARGVVNDSVDYIIERVKKEI